MIELGFSKAITGGLDLMPFVEAISGLVLIIVGSRAIRLPERYAKRQTAIKHDYGKHLKAISKKDTCY